MSGEIGKACGREHPKAPSAKHLWKDKTTGAELEFLRDTRAGCLVTVRMFPREEGEGGENAEDGPGPLYTVIFSVSFFCFFPLLVFLSFFCLGG